MTDNAFDLFIKIQNMDKWSKHYFKRYKKIKYS